MRDKQRDNEIRDICHRLYLCQLIVNATPERFQVETKEDTTATDPYYLNDEEIIKEIERGAYASFSQARRIAIQRKPLVEDDES